MLRGPLHNRGADGLCEACGEPFPCPDGIAIFDSVVNRTRAAGLVPNNEPMPPMHGPPHHCSNCGRPISSGPEGGRKPGEHLRRAGMPNVIEQRELRQQGLVDPPGHYLPWWGVTFVCADCLERWRRTPPLPDRD